MGFGSVQTDRLDEQVADDREQQRDQRPGDGDAGVHHPLEYFVDHVLLGDVTGERVADQLDVVLDRSEFALLVGYHRPQAVVEDAFDVGDVRLQRTDRGGVIFWSQVLACR